MVPRLRVAVRVVSEDEYLTHLAKGPPGPGLYRGEKKFAVVIQNPQQWQIGHLAAEVKRQFKKLYGRDVGTLKYLSHGFDDCQLHKDLSVYEHLYDEGRARTDLGDQYVVVKAVFSQGRPLREGSVMPDFDDPRYEQRPIPPVPVPSWPQASSKSGKRPAEEDDEQYFGTNEYSDVKRQRLCDPEETNSDDDIAQSVERDEPMQGPDTILPTSQIVILDSQSSPQNGIFQPIQQRSLPNNGPTLFRPSHTSTTGQTSSPSKRLKFDQVSESSADLPIPKHLRFDPNHGKTQALLTPPSDASKKSSNRDTKHFLAHSSKKKSSPSQATTSGLRRVGTVQKDIYDMEKSDEIECSLMSPNSKLATAKKISRSSSGSKSSSKASRSHKESETPDRFKGTIPNSEVLKLMEDGAFIQPASSKRLRPAIAYGTPEYNFTADEDGYSQQGDVLQVRNASATAWHLPSEHISYAQSKEQVAGPFTALSLPKNNGLSQAVTDNQFGDIATEEEAVASSPVNAETDEESDLGEDEASAAPQHPPVSKGQNPPLSLRDKIAAASKQVAKTSPDVTNKRKRQRRSQFEVEKTEDPLSVDTAYARLDTKQSTPMDSPGEQLLEMQASSQKSRQNSQTKATKKTEKRAEIRRQKQEKIADTWKLPAADRCAREKQLQKPKLVSRAQPVDNPLTVDPKAAEELARSEAASKSPYARPSPPKGSMGLGFTDSPRRPSTLSTSGSSLSPRRLFQTESAPAQVVGAVTIADNETDSDSSDESFDESSESEVATPSKQAPPEKSLSPYQRCIAKLKLTAEPQQPAAISKVKSELALRSESSAPAVLPIGMTMKQFEAKKKQYDDAPLKPKDPVNQRERKVQTERALQARASSTRSTSSVAASEKPESKASKAPKRQLTVGALAATGGSTTTNLPNKKPEGTGTVQKKAARPITKPTKTPSTTASESSKASQPMRAKATKATKPPSTAVSESSKASQPARAQVTQATAAAPAANKTKAPTLTVPEPGSLLKNLKHRVAGQSARNSPAAPTFALPPKPVARGFNALEEESDDESDSDSEDDEDVEEKRVNVVKAARPDQSTRSVVVDDDKEEETEDSEDEED